MERLELECSFPNRTHDYSHDLWQRRDRKVVLLGYLVHDDDVSSDPLSNCDGMGKIVTKHLDHGFMRHLGRDNDGEPILDEQVALLARIRGVDIDGFECDTELLIDMWEEARKQNKIGTPYAVGLSYFDREGYVEAEGRGHRWKIDAAWVPDKYLMEHIELFAPENRAREARAAFEIAISEYNKWATGDCWGVVVDVFEYQDDGTYELKENDACWGYVGYDYAMQELRESLAGWRAQMTKEKTCSSKTPCPSSAPSPTA